MAELALENEIPFKRNKGKKVLIISIVAALVIGIIAYIVYTKTSAQSNSSSLVQYVTVKRGDVTETISASGTAQAAQQVSISGDSSTKITAINVKVGDNVKAGQVLATLDDTDAKSKLESAQASLTVAQAKLTQVQQGTSQDDIANQQISVNKAQLAVNNAQQKYNDTQAQFNAKKATQSDVDQANIALQQAQQDYNLAVSKLNQLKAPPKDSDVQSAKAAVDQAQATVQQQQVALDKLTIKAPIDGVIVQVNGTVGDSPSNGGGSGSTSSSSSASSSSKGFIVMDSNTNQVKITAQVSQSDISKVQNDMQATITTTAFDNKTFNGKVSSIAPEATTQSGVTTYDVVVSVDNTDNVLKPGMTTNVTIQVGNHQNVLYVPSMALKSRSGKDGVYVQNTSGSQSSASSQSGQSSQNAQSSQSGQRGQNAGIPSNLRFQPVTVGFYGTDKVEIASGLKEGDQVAIIMGATRNNNSTSGNRGTNGTNGFSGFGGGGSGSGFGGSGFGGGGSRGGN